MALVGVAHGNQGGITIPDVTPQYDNMLAEIFRWTMRFESEELDSTVFLADPTTANVGFFLTTAKGMYTVRGSIDAYWDTAGATTAHAAFKQGRASVDLVLIQANRGTTDATYTVNAHLNNFNFTVNKQSGLMALSCDFVGNGDVENADIVAGVGT